MSGTMSSCRSLLVALRISRSRVFRADMGAEREQMTFGLCPSLSAALTPGHPAAELPRRGPPNSVEILPFAEHLVEQIDHRPPRAFVGDRIVGQRRIANLAGIWVGEAVHRAAIGMQLPVHLGLPHLLFEGGDLRRWNKRIVGAVTDQHLAADALVVVRPRRLQPAMEADGGPQRCTAPGQFKRRAAAEAITDRRKLPAIH